jgi:iron complex transport system ATP-binding protein
MSSIDTARAAITVDSVSYTYGSNFSIDTISCRLEKGAFSFLLGPNGAGKTTLFRLAVGLLKPISGKVTIFNDPVDTLSRNDIAKKIAIVEQDPSYTFPFTVEELILMGRYPHASWGLFDSAADSAKAVWAMELTHTRQFRDRPVLSLSGGERRRVEIARALAQEASIILLDEPASHLDIKQQRELFRMLRKLKEETEITIWVISHHIYLARQYATHIHFMRDGTIQEMTDKSILDNETELLTMF